MLRLFAFIVTVLRYIINAPRLIRDICKPHAGGHGRSALHCNTAAALLICDERCVPLRGPPAPLQHAQRVHHGIVREQEDWDVHVLHARCGGGATGVGLRTFRACRCALSFSRVTNVPAPISASLVAFYAWLCVFRGSKSVFCLGVVGIFHVRGWLTAIACFRRRPLPHDRHPRACSGAVHAG